MREMLFIFSQKFIEGFGYNRDEYCGGFAHVEKVNFCCFSISLLFFDTKGMDVTGRDL